MPINDRKGGRLPPLAEVVEFDFAPMLDQVGRLDESFQRIARSASRLLDALRGVNTELSTIVPAVERLRFGELTVTAREETSRDVAERLRRRGTVEGVTGADSSTILGRAISFGIGGTLRDIVTAPFRFGANLLQSSAGQAISAAGPYGLVGAGLLAGNYKLTEDAYLGSQDIAGAGAAYLAYKNIPGLLNRITGGRLAGSHVSLQSLRLAGTFARAGAYGAAARTFGFGTLPFAGALALGDLARAGIRTGFTGEPFDEGLSQGFLYRTFYGLTGIDPEAVDRVGYGVLDAVRGGVPRSRWRRGLPSRFYDTSPQVVEGADLGTLQLHERFALRGRFPDYPLQVSQFTDRQYEEASQYVGQIRGITDQKLSELIKRGNVEAAKELLQLSQDSAAGASEAFRRSVADVNLATGQVTLGGLGRGSLFAASQFSPGSLGAQVGQFGRAGRILGEAAQFDPEFGRIAAGARSLETQGRGIISQLPTWERLREEAAALHTDIEGLEDASRAFGQAGASAVRNLITDFNSLGDTFKGLITLVAELVLQVAVFTPLQNALSSAFSVGYGAIAGGGGSVPGAVNSTGGWIPPGGSNVVINNSYEGVSRSQAVELAAVGRTQAVEDVRRAQGQITSDQYNGRL